MVSAFDKCDTRPAHIDAILNGLDRYNPETTTVFQDYVVQQCEDRTFDCYANLALLKLYVFFLFFDFPVLRLRKKENGIKSMMNILFTTFPIT
jgi:hypothetical protein